MKLKIFVIALILSSAVASGFSWSSFDFGGKEKAALIELSGTIKPASSSSLLQDGGITPDEVRSLNSKALRQGASAIIYEINSGGGAVVASKEIKRIIEDVRKPTICRIRDIGASGAYLASLGCDRIVADSASITGSIGVKASYLEYSGLLQKFGIEYVNITAGKNKDLGSQYQNITPREKEMLKEKIKQVHRQFISIVDKERNLSEKDLKKIKTGEIFLGEEAVELGLIDKLGGRETSIETAENITGDQLKPFEVEKRSGFNIFSFLTSNIDFPGFDSKTPIKMSYK